MEAGNLHALWLVPAAVALYILAHQRNRTALRRFVGSSLGPALSHSFNTRRWMGKAALVVVSVGLIVTALARPAWNPHPQQTLRRGRDIVFVVDVSRSMLAEDLRPNRLERAKLAIKDLLGSLQGDRVGLIAFAGTAVVKCPLTTDYGFLRIALDDLNPEYISRGGSLIGDAIRTALNDVFDEKSAAYQDLILISDGEDHGSFPVEAAAQAGDLGIRIIAVGLGDDRTGSVIPSIDSQGRSVPMTYAGEVVHTTLCGDVLREIALASRDGRYLHVATGNIELDHVYKAFVRQAERRELEETQVTRYDEKYQLFLAAAVVLLAVEMCLSERRRRTT